VLWGDAGIGGWSGALIVPALDDVYLIDAGGPQGVVSEGIRALYRSYVKEGYKPGIATVYRGHYILPILNSDSAVFDTLVCRLDLRDSRGNTRPAWTRWDGAARGTAWATRTGAGAPSLFTGRSGYLMDATGVFLPSAANKDDDVAVRPGFDFDVTTRDYDTGPGNRNSISGLRMRYELVDAAADNPTIAASYSTGPEGAAFTALSTSAPENDGSDPYTWRFVKRTRRARFRFLSSGPSANLKLRVVEVLVRPSSRS
jgi:hypothetical protein